jgi:hypothetical protein
VTIDTSISIVAGRKIDITLYDEMVAPYVYGANKKKSKYISLYADFLLHLTQHTVLFTTSGSRQRLINKLSVSVHFSIEEYNSLTTYNPAAYFAYYSAETPRDFRQLPATCCCCSYCPGPLPAAAAPV